MRLSHSQLTWVLSLLKSKLKNTSKCLHKWNPTGRRALPKYCWQDPSVQSGRINAASLGECYLPQPSPRPEGLHIKMTPCVAAGQAAFLVAICVTEFPPSCLCVHQFMASITQHIPVCALRLALGNSGMFPLCCRASFPWPVCLCLVLTLYCPYRVRWGKKELNKPN